mgnify:CR=1 FL=1
MVRTVSPWAAAEEPEAYAWLSGAAQDLGKEPVAYYLAFYRDSTPAQPRGEVTLTVTSRQGTDLFYMDGSARSAKLSYAAESDSIRFQMEKTGYYLTVKNDKPPRPEEPKTGDSFRPEPYLLTGTVRLIFSAGEVCSGSPLTCCCIWVCMAKGAFMLPFSQYNDTT